MQKEATKDFADLILKGNTYEISERKTKDHMYLVKNEKGKWFWYYKSLFETVEKPKFKPKKKKPVIEEEIQSSDTFGEDVIVEEIILND